MMDGARSTCWSGLYGKLRLVDRRADHLEGAVDFQRLALAHEIEHGHRVGEHVVDPVHRRFRLRIEADRQQAQIRGIDRAEHAAVLTERDRTAVVITGCMANLEQVGPHAGSLGHIKLA
jgi:hypothetical protein